MRNWYDYEDEPRTVGWKEAFFSFVGLFLVIAAVIYVVKAFWIEPNGVVESKWRPLKVMEEMEDDSDNVFVLGIKISDKPEQEEICGYYICDDQDALWENRNDFYLVVRTFQRSRRENEDGRIYLSCNGEQLKLMPFTIYRSYDEMRFNEFHFDSLEPYFREVSEDEFAEIFGITIPPWQRKDSDAT